MSREGDRKAERRVQPLSDELADLLERSYDAFNRRDLETLLSLYHRDCIWDMTHFGGWPDTPVYRGHDGLRRLFQEWFVAWDEIRVWWSDVQFLDAASGFLSAHLRGSGAASGVEVALDWTQVAEVRDGLIYSVENYTERSEALAAVGLLE